MHLARTTKLESGPNMTPLVDIVMVILIFLMLTGVFAAGEYFLQSRPMAGGGKPTASTPPVTKLEVRVASYNDQRTGQECWAASVTGQPMQIINSRLHLTELLRHKRQQLMSAGDASDSIQVILSPTGRTRYKHLLEAYQAALAADLQKVAFGTARTN